MLISVHCEQQHGNNVTSILSFWVCIDCVDQDIEVCALKTDSTFSNICILAIYRSPLGNFNTYVTQ